MDFSRPVKTQSILFEEELYVMLLFGGHMRSGVSGEKVDVLSWKGICNFPDNYPAPLSNATARIGHTVASANGNIFLCGGFLTKR